MKKVKRFMPSALVDGYLNLSFLFHGHGTELKLLAVVGVITIYCCLEIIQFQSKAKPHFLDISSLYNIHIAEHVPFMSTPIGVKKKDSDSATKINVEELISTSMNYSYAETQFGFYLKNVNFLSTNPKGVVEKKILASLPPSLANRAKKYLRAVLILSQKHQVDPLWVLSVMWTESHFEPTAKSFAGARGLMQLMPETKSYVYRDLVKRGINLEVEEDHFNIHNYYPHRITDEEFKSHTAKLVNIELGIIYLKNLLNYFEDHKYATVAYNMGPTWTIERLKNNEPVGQKNQYLTKVENAYKRLARRI